MPRGACDRCRRDYALNPASRFQAGCPRCGQRLRIVPGDEPGKLSSEPPMRPAPYPLAAPASKAGRAWSTKSARSRSPRLLRRASAAGAAALCLGAAVLLGSVPARRPAPQPSLPPVTPRPARTRFEAALREAHAWDVRARSAVAHDLEKLDSTDPTISPRVMRQDWDELMAVDRSGARRRALQAAGRAADLAETADEKYQAGELLAWLECCSGHHEQELVQARALVSLEPWNPHALEALRRAAVCNHLKLLEQQAETELAELRSTQKPDETHPQ